MRLSVQTTEEIDITQCASQMRVLLNASALSGVIIFTVANIMGMNVGSAPDRLSGAASFNDSPLAAYPLFLTVRISLVTCASRQHNTPT